MAMAAGEPQPQPQPRRILRVFHDDRWKDVPEDELPSFYRNSFFFLGASTIFLASNYTHLTTTTNRSSNRTAGSRNPDAPRSDNPFRRSNASESAGSAGAGTTSDSGSTSERGDDSGRRGFDPFGSPLNRDGVGVGGVGGGESFGRGASGGSNSSRASAEERREVRRVFRDNRWMDVYEDWSNVPSVISTLESDESTTPNVFNLPLPRGRTAQYLYSLESFDLNSLNLNNSVLPRERLSDAEKAARRLRMATQIVRQREKLISDIKSNSIPLAELIQEIARTGEFAFVEKNPPDESASNKSKEKSKKNKIRFIIPDSFESYYIIVHYLHLSAVRISGYTNPVYLKEFEQEIINTLTDQHNHHDNFEDFRFLRNFHNFPTCPKFLSSLTTYPTGSVALKDRNQDCSICLDELSVSPAMRFPCSHLFHQYCISRWTAHSSNCPVCRHLFPIDTEFLEDSFITNRCGLLIALIWNEIRRLCETHADSNFIFVLDSLGELGGSKRSREGEEDEGAGLRRRFRHAYDSPEGASPPNNDESENAESDSESTTDDAPGNQDEPDAAGESGASQGAAMGRIASAYEFVGYRYVPRPNDEASEDEGDGNENGSRYDHNRHMEEVD